MFQLVYFYRLRLLSPPFVYVVYYTRKLVGKQVQETFYRSWIGNPDSFGMSLKYIGKDRSLPSPSHGIYSKCHETIH